MRTEADGGGRGRATAAALAALLVAGTAVAYAQRLQPDILNYSFFITLSDSSDTIAVTAFLGFGLSQSGADTLDLDLVGMTVDAVSASGSDADTACARIMAEASRAGQSALCASEMPSIPFTYDGRKLRIALPKPTSRRRADDEGQGETAAIRYQRVPTGATRSPFRSGPTRKTRRSPIRCRSRTPRKLSRRWNGSWARSRTRSSRTSSPPRSSAAWRTPAPSSTRKDRTLKDVWEKASCATRPRTSGSATR